MLNIMGILVHKRSLWHILLCHCCLFYFHCCCFLFVWSYLNISMCRWMLYLYLLIICTYHYKMRYTIWYICSYITKEVTFFGQIFLASFCASGTVQCPVAIIPCSVAAFLLVKATPWRKRLGCTLQSKLNQLINISGKNNHTWIFL